MADFDYAGLNRRRQSGGRQLCDHHHGKVTPPNADLSIHHGSPNLPHKYYIENRGHGWLDYWGSYSKAPGPLRLHQPSVCIPRR
jgi:hypothetical protein